MKCSNGQKLTPTQSLALVVAHYVPAEKRQAGRWFTTVVFKNIRDDLTDEQLAAAVAVCAAATLRLPWRTATQTASPRDTPSSTLSSESAVKCIAQFNDSESLATPGDRIAVVQHFKTS